MLALGGVFCFDVLSPPERQTSARIYVFAVEQYQRFGRSIIQGRIACRFRPSCSAYSIISVKRYGFFRGVYLTFNRLSRCQNSVPMGTNDPVP